MGDGAVLNGVSDGLDKLSQHMLDGETVAFRKKMMRRDRSVYVAAIVVDGGKHAGLSRAYSALDPATKIAFAQVLADEAQRLKVEALKESQATRTRKLKALPDG